MIDLSAVALTIREAANYHIGLGEGPLWIEREQKLYWLDILEGRVYAYHPASGTSEKVFDWDRLIGGIAETEDGALVVLADRGGVFLWRDGGIVKTVIEGIEQESVNRFNDCIADPEGRLFAGTIHLDDPNERTGRLYRIDPDGSCKVMKNGVGISNGMAFSVDLQHFFFTDTLAKTIWKYDYDRATGDISNERVFLQFDPATKNPDGMTMDADGNLWVAHCMQGHICVYDPDGAEIGRVDVPAKFVTSLTFGGPGYRTIFVSTGNDGHNGPEWGASAGALLMMDAPVMGRREFKVGSCVTEAATAWKGSPKQ